MAELQKMKDDAEAAGVGVLMGYNKVRCYIVGGISFRRKLISITHEIVFECNHLTTAILQSIFVECVQICSQDT